MTKDQQFAAIDHASYGANVTAAIATKLHPPYNSAHDGFAVLLEEVDELKEHVWTSPGDLQRLDAMRVEALQVAAAAIRFAAFCCGEQTGMR